MRLHRLFKKKKKESEVAVTISKKRRLDFLRKLVSKEKDLPPRAMIAGEPVMVEWDFKD
jgi:predicted hydrolase (HD superfamily)